jgi:hypothetical protein
MGLSKMILIFTDLQAGLPYLYDEDRETDKRLEDRQIYIPILD